MRATRGTSSSRKASKPCERAWKQLREHLKERREKNFVQSGGILKRAYKRYCLVNTLVAADAVFLACFPLAVPLRSSEFKLKSGINVAPYGLPPFIPF
jgi:hypothetical protein